MALKAGQKVWYINHTWNTLEEGTLISTENQSTSRDEHPTFSVKDKKYSMKHIILTDWIFTTNEKGKAELKKKIQRDIRRKKGEIKGLERKLQFV